MGSRSPGADVPVGEGDSVGAVYVRGRVPGGGRRREPNPSWVCLFMGPTCDRSGEVDHREISSRQRVAGAREARNHRYHRNHIFLGVSTRGQTGPPTHVPHLPYIFNIFI